MIACFLVCLRHFLFRHMCPRLCGYKEDMKLTIKPEPVAMTTNETEPQEPEGWELPPLS
jgi:hypothetical protein